MIITYLGRTSPSGMSCDGMYGLTSSTGVPSIKSTEEKYKNPPSRSTFSSFTCVFDDATI